MQDQKFPSQEEQNAEQSKNELKSALRDYFEERSKTPNPSGKKTGSGGVENTESFAAEQAKAQTPEGASQTGSTSAQTTSSTASGGIGALVPSARRRIRL